VNDFYIKPYPTPVVGRQRSVRSRLHLTVKSQV